jgi:hypothetical protein
MIACEKPLVELSSLMGNIEEVVSNPLLSRNPKPPVSESTFDNGYSP